MIMASSFTPPTMILDLALMAMLVVVAFTIVRLRSLFAIVMLQGVYSLVCAAWFVSLDAVDVAFTEAAVGAGVSTVLMLAAMLLADRQSEPVPISKQIAPIIVVIVAGLAMFYAIGDMPAPPMGSASRRLPPLRRLRLNLRQNQQGGLKRFLWLRFQRHLLPRFLKDAVVRQDLKIKYLRIHLKWPPPKRHLSADVDAPKAPRISPKQEAHLNA